MGPIRAIGFDLDHTLAIDNKLERVAFLHLLEALLSGGGRTRGTLSDEIDAIDALLARQRRGDCSIDEAVRSFVADHALEPSTQYVDAFRQAAVGMVENFVVPLPGVKATLRALRQRGIAVAILSNGWNPLQVRKAARAGFEGPVLVSSEIGIQKPALGAFEALLATLATVASQTWYVGDDPHIDVAGAQEAGMRTVWINWERKTYPLELRPPAYTIAQFEELLELVSAPVGVSS
jgi:HAD superfamily hydrolase (TIGR01509 family)